MSNVIFSDLELLAQQSLRDHKEYVSSHGRLSSLGSILLAGVGQGLAPDPAASLIQKFHRVMYFGAFPEIDKTISILLERYETVIERMIWIVGNISAVHAANIRIPIPNIVAVPHLSQTDSLRFKYLGQDDCQETILSMQRLQREAHLTPLPEDYLRNTQQVVTAYFHNNHGEVVAASSCGRIKVGVGSFSRPVMMQTTCVRQDLRLVGLAPILKAAAVEEAIRKFSPDCVTGVVSSDTVVVMNAAFGIQVDYSIGVARVKKKISVP